MRKYIALALLGGASAGLMADEPGYRLSIDTALQGGTLTVMPRVAASAGSALRYEMTASKEGRAGRTSTRQSGRLVVGEGGSASFSTLRLGVTPQDRYELSVKLFQGERLVASQTLRYPEY